MPRAQHWTEQSAKAFAHWAAFDFIAQVEKRMEVDGISQADLAHRLHVTEGSVSHVLNNPQNLTLKTVAKYARVLGMKVALVAYDDGDPSNEIGPISSEIFTACWRLAGTPHDIWGLDAIRQQSANNNTRVIPGKISQISQTAQTDQVIEDLTRKGQRSTAARKNAPIMFIEGGGVYARS